MWSKKLRNKFSPLVKKKKKRQAEPWRMSSIGYERGDHITKDSGSKLSDSASKAAQVEMSE